MFLNQADSEIDSKRDFSKSVTYPSTPQKGALQVHFIAECSRGAAEDDVEERENSEVTQFFGWAGDGDGRTDDDDNGWKDRQNFLGKYCIRYTLSNYL